MISNISMKNQEPQSKNNSKSAGYTPKAQIFQQKVAPKIYNMRCPSCAKLYRVAAELISSSSPHFDCQVCHSSFTFDYPPRHPNSIHTHLLKGPSKNISFSQAAHLDFNENHFRKCPKCQHVNPKHVEECAQCHVLLSKLEGLPLEAKTGAFPSLIKMWHELLADYDNLTKHVAFVNRCEDLQAIPFALKKYRSMKEAQPHDEVASQMIHQVVLRSFGNTADRMAEASRLKYIYSKINWTRVMKLLPILMGLGLIAVGLASHALRNLVGIGVALMVLTIGLRIFKSGEIRHDDFY